MRRHGLLGVATLALIVAVPASGLLVSRTTLEDGIADGLQRRR
jgi:hypothetical protein